MDAVVPPPQHGIAPWDIVRVDFPSADQATTRRRPALVIAAPAATDASSIVWVLMFTSAAQGHWPLCRSPISTAAACRTPALSG